MLSNPVDAVILYLQLTLIPHTVSQRLPLHAFFLMEAHIKEEHKPVTPKRAKPSATDAPNSLNI